MIQPRGRPRPQKAPAGDRKDLEVLRMETRQDSRQGAGQQERSLGELFGDLTRDMSTLIRQETQLATHEMTQKATRAGKSAGVLVGGALIAYAGFFALLWAIVYGLTSLFGWPIAISFLIVAIIVL